MVLEPCPGRAGKGGACPVRGVGEEAGSSRGEDLKARRSGLRWLEISLLRRCGRAWLAGALGGLVAGRVVGADAVAGVGGARRDGLGTVGAVARVELRGEEVLRRDVDIAVGIGDRADGIRGGPPRDGMRARLAVGLGDQHIVVGEHVPAAGGGDEVPLDPIEGLGGGVRLVVVPCLGEGGELVEVIGEPGGIGGEVDEAARDHGGLRVQAHDFVARGRVGGDGVEPFGDELLDQLGAGGLVLDEDDLGAVERGLVAHGALEARVVEPLAQDVEQIEVAVLDAPGGADAVIGEVGRLVGGVPALEDALEARGEGFGRVGAEPFGLDHAAAERGRGLLVLAGEMVGAERAAELLEDGQGLALGVQRLAGAAAEAAGAEGCCDGVLLVLLGAAASPGSAARPPARARTVPAPARAKNPCSSIAPAYRDQNTPSGSSGHDGSPPGPPGPGSPPSGPGPDAGSGDAAVAAAGSA